MTAGGNERMIASVETLSLSERRSAMVITDIEPFGFGSAIAKFNEEYVRAYEHNVAHGQRATRARKWTKRAAITAALLAVLTGTAWTGDVAGAGVFSSTTVQIVAAIAAFASAAVTGISTANDWNKQVVDHTAAEDRWEAVMRDLASLRVAPTEPEVIKRLDQDRVAAATAEPDLSADDLEKARHWVSVTVAERRQIAGRL
jgi:hypothetical protein